MADVMIAWMKDPAEIYVQLVSQEEQLLEITRKLEEVYSQLTGGQHDLQTVAVGASCVAQFSQDNAWYRAVIREVNGRQVSVKFVGRLKRDREGETHTYVHLVTNTTQIHTHAHTLAHAHVHTRTYAYTHSYTHIYTHTLTHIHSHLLTRTRYVTYVLICRIMMKFNLGKLG